MFNLLTSFPVMSTVDTLASLQKPLDNQKTAGKLLKVDRCLKLLENVNNMFLFDNLMRDQK